MCRRGAVTAAGGRESRSTKETIGWGAIVGSMPTQFGVALALYVAGRFTDRPALARVGSDLACAELAAQTFSYGLKYSIRRTRPDGTSFSFPSGHTAVSVATATVLQRHYGWRTGLAAYAVAAYVASSRVRVRRHHLSDVAVGALIGLVAGRTITMRRNHARSARPPATPGVGFTGYGPP